MFGCRSRELVDCVANVVSQQCGEEIGGQARALGNKILQDIGCTKRKRQLFRLFRPALFFHCSTTASFCLCCDFSVCVCVCVFFLFILM